MRLNRNYPRASQIKMSCYSELAPQKVRLEEFVFPCRLRSARVIGLPPEVTVFGQLGIIKNKPLLGLLCSQACPGDVILKTYDVIRALRDAGVCVISGFHSTMEKECLEILLRGQQPVVVCPARGIQDMRLPAPWKEALATGRLLVLSPFEAPVRRVTKETAQQRNRFVTAMADRVLVPYASPGGEIDALCRECAVVGKQVVGIAQIEKELSNA